MISVKSIIDDAVLTIYKTDDMNMEIEIQNKVLIDLQFLVEDIIDHTVSNIFEGI